MVYTANWGIICHLPPIKGNQKQPLILGLWKDASLVWDWDLHLDKPDPKDAPLLTDAERVEVGVFTAGRWWEKTNGDFDLGKRWRKTRLKKILPLLDNLQDFLTYPTCKKLGKPSTQILYAIMPYQRDRCAFPGGYLFVTFLGC